MARLSLPSRSAGFSLVEAMVALLIVGLVAAAGFALLNRSAALTARLADDTRRARAEAMALEVIRRTNPMVQPHGELGLVDCRLTWDAEAIAGPVRNASGPNANGVFDVGLFDVHVRAVRDQREWFSFRVRQVGFRRTAAFTASAPGH